jgi:NADH-quinone oxidoreductase subunit J
MAETVNGIAFIILSFSIIVGAIGMLATKNIIHSGFWLLEVSIVAAAIYYLLGADYIALVQLLVYAGAVSVIIIFSIMLTLRRREDATRSRDFSVVAVIVAALFCALAIVMVVVFPLPEVALPDSAPTFTEFSIKLFSPDGWALPFELASAVLTVALVGAVWWSRKEKK